MSQDSTNPRVKETENESYEVEISDTRTEEQSQNPELPQTFFSLSSHEDSNNEEHFTIDDTRSVNETNPSASAAFVGGVKMPLPPSVIAHLVKERED